jgi:hypothetical protein
VPPVAATTRPLPASAAPVNDPRLCPKSWDSKSASGIAAQLTATKAPGRPLLACSSRANSSLPVPLSPCSTTEASVRATRSTAASAR